MICSYPIEHWHVFLVNYTSTSHTERRAFQKRGMGAPYSRARHLPHAAATAVFLGVACRVIVTPFHSQPRVSQ